MTKNVQMHSPVYLDCNATAPLEPVVRDVVVGWFMEEIGNAGSRTHTYGLRAKQAVEIARRQVAAVMEAKTDEVVFTSGATESNNLAILGLAPFGQREGRKHIISTAIEHKAVLEPLEILQDRGFLITLDKPDSKGIVHADTIQAALQPDTLLVSVMQVNNETGTRQPIEDIASRLEEHDAYFHVDAAQGFGKELNPLISPRIDLISISSHKIYGPIGVGALVGRRRGFKKPPLTPLSFGGGQERGLRAGTVPVPLIVGLGLAAETAQRDAEQRKEHCSVIRSNALRALSPLNILLHTELDQTLPHVLNFSVNGVDSEAIMIALKDLLAISNGSACTSQSYEPSYVLKAMGLPESAISGAVRLSWCHLTPDIDWHAVAERISLLQG